MKKQKFILPALFLLIVLTSYNLADEIISRLGMEHRTARHYIFSNLVGSFEEGPMEENNEDGGSNAAAYDQMKSFRIPYARLLPAVIKGDKTGAAKELLFITPSVDVLRNIPKSELAPFAYTISALPSRSISAITTCGTELDTE